MPFRTSKGFTLIEMIMTLVIVGVVAASISMYIRIPIESYFDISRRAAMADAADTALRRISRELHHALPNSVRVSGNRLVVEFLPIVAAGRYRSTQDCTGACTGNAIGFDANATSFDVIGPPVTMSAGDQIVIYNLGIAGADAYAGDNRRAYNGTAGAQTTIQISSTSAIPFDSPARRFQVINTPVSYICDIGAASTRTLRRYAGYPIQLGQPVTAAALDALAASSLLAENVESCEFTYENGLTQRNGLVSLRLTLRRNDENVTLIHQVHVNNVP